jgi:hypothetical protein
MGKKKGHKEEAEGGRLELLCEGRRLVLLCGGEPLELLSMGGGPVPRSSLRGADARPSV